MEKSTLVCPKCGSIEIKRDYRPGMNRHDLSKMNIYSCLDCDYVGVMPLIDTDQVEKFKIEIKEQESEE